jgi:flagellar hook-length control protein FliK
MFKSMSEILFPPRSTKQVAEAAAAPAADLAFAEVLQDAEEIEVEIAVGTAFLPAILQDLLPRPVAPASTTGEAARAAAALDCVAVPLVTGAPTDEAVTKEESTPTSTTADGAGQMLAMIFGAAASERPAEIRADPDLMPQAALGELATDTSPGIAPRAQFVAEPVPPQSSTAEPVQAVAWQAATKAPEPPPAIVPKRLDAEEPADELSDLKVPDTNRVTDPPAPKTEPRPTSSEPAVQAKVETTSGGATLHHKSSSGTAPDISADAAVVQDVVFARVATPRHEEGATQFLWRQALQTDAAQPDPPPAQHKIIDSGPTSHAPEKGREIPAADLEPAAAVDRDDSPPATPLVASLSTTDGPTALPEAEVTKPEAPVSPGVALGAIQTEGTLRSQIHDGTVQRPAPPTPVRQVVEILAAQPADVPGRIELTLTPETLGKVHFDMRPEGDSLSIVLSAERADTLELMRRHLPDLMAELKQAGIQAGSFSFSSWNEGQRAQSPQLAAPPFEPTETPVAVPTPPTRPVRAVSHLGGLDMRF